MVNTSAQGSRDALVYGDATGVRLFRNHAVMGGFRFRGQYTRGDVPTFPMPASKLARVTGSGLGAESIAKEHNWYAAFACANDGEATATIKTMPFIRVRTIIDPTPPFQHVYTFNEAGEGVHAQADNGGYNFANDILAGAECLVISENEAFSGHVANILGNSTSHVELDYRGAIQPLDWLLPAPPGFEHFVYLGSFYFEGEVRNFFDSGTLVKGKMINILSGDISSGAFGAPGAKIECGGYISPLATAIILDSTASLSTGSTGAVAEYFDGDGGNHVVQTAYFNKHSATTETYMFDNIQVPFLYHQWFRYQNAGSLSVTRVSGQLQVTGWIEP